MKAINELQEIHFHRLEESPRLAGSFDVQAVLCRLLQPGF
jgi:hypothetical protein